MRRLLPTLVTLLLRNTAWLVVSTAGVDPMKLHRSTPLAHALEYSRDRSVSHLPRSFTMPYRATKPVTALACLALLSPVLRCLAGSEPPAIDAAVAVIGPEQVTFGQVAAATQPDLDASERRYQRKLQQLEIDHRRERHAILESHVNNFLDRKLLEREAESKHESVEQLIKDVKSPEVSDADITAFYEQHKEQLKQPFEAAMVPITKYLMGQSIEQGKAAYLASLRSKYAARVTLEPLREVVAADGPSRGPTQARVTVIEFADFQCPYCRHMEPLIRQMLDKYPQDVRLVYRQMPLANLHPDAMHAAQASLCAAAQGKFWEMHDALFSDPPALSVVDLKATAARLHLRSEEFVACLDSGRTESLVKRDADDALAHAVDGTPGLFINGRFFSGAMPLERLTAVIDDELQSRPLNFAATPAEGRSRP
jgi:protein-disulfide isomerase